MLTDTATPFDTIESAHDFVTLLKQTLAEAKIEVSADADREAGNGSNRRLDALRIAVYNLDRLEFHLTKSARLLNDLRSIRRLLFEERAARPAAVAVAAKPKAMPHTAAVPRNGHPVAVA